VRFFRFWKFYREARFNAFRAAMARL